MDSNYVFIIFAGILGTLSTLFSKLAGQGQSNKGSFAKNVFSSPMVSMSTSILISVLVPIFNSRALRTIPASTVTMVGFIINFLSTAIVDALWSWNNGNSIGNEFSKKWIFGVILMIVGVGICMSDKSSRSPESLKND